MPDTSTKLILASTSPRRKEILERLQIPFCVVSPAFEEISNAALSPKEEAIYFAKGKAQSVAVNFKKAIVIGSDTLIECDKKKLRKPRDAEEARQILQGLQGRSHLIWTAVFMIDTLQNRSEVSICKIEVSMKSMTTHEIADYVGTGEPLEKAGAYAVQGEGRRFIHELKGNYLAAVGLPLEAISRFVKRLM